MLHGLRYKMRNKKRLRPLLYLKELDRVNRASTLLKLYNVQFSIESSDLRFFPLFRQLLFFVLGTHVVFDLGYQRNVYLKISRKLLCVRKRHLKSFKIETTVFNFQPTVPCFVEAFSSSYLLWRTFSTKFYVWTLLTCGPDWFFLQSR